MWMMKSCYSSSDQHKMSTTTSTNNMSGESFNGRRLRPLIPRVPSAASSDLSSSSSTVANSNNRSAPQKHGSCFGRLNDTAADPLTLNHIYQVDHNNKKPICTNTGGGGGGGGGVIASSRWNPTPEQLRTLEELYGRGTRTPSADQIQHITSQLRRYGKIEGKNVFYWFQNHKARERQKRRREIECTVSPTPPRNNNNNKNNIFEANPSSTYDEEMLNYDNHPNHRGGGGGVPDSSIIARKQTSTVRGGRERLGSMRTELFHDVENHETMNWACSLNYSSAAAAAVAAAPAPAPPAASYSYLQEYSRDVLKILHDNPMETRTAKANDVDSGDDRGNRDQHHYHVHDHDDHVHGWIKVQDEDEDEEEKGMEVEEGEFQFQFKFQPTRNLSASERNSRCHMQNHLSSSTFHSRPLPFPSAAAATTITATTTTATSTESATTPITTIHPPFYYFNNTYNYNNIIATTAATPSFTLSNLADAMHRNFLTSPTTAAITTNSMTNYMGKSLDDHNNNISSSASSQTLQLFPLESPVSGGMDDGEAMVEPEEERETPAVFFEFLPLKE